MSFRYDSWLAGSLVFGSKILSKTSALSRLKIRVGACVARASRP